MLEMILKLISGEDAFMQNCMPNGWASLLIALGLF